MQRPLKVQKSCSNERALVRSPSNNSLVITSKDLTKPVLNVETIHLSCESDVYEGNQKKYGGIIIYSRDGQSQWQTANGKRCRSGYLVIKDTSDENVMKWLGSEPGEVHGAVYRSAFGESMKGHKIEGEGFSIQSGELIPRSGIFNVPYDEAFYHNGDKQMAELTQRCVREVVKEWKSAGTKPKPTLGCRNFMVHDLLARRPRCTWVEPEPSSFCISEESDEYSYRNCEYAGIVLFSRDGKNEWVTDNGKRCKSGDIVIRNTSSNAVRQWIHTEPGRVHGAVYRSVFGESICDHAIAAAGFSIQNGIFSATSRVFNTPRTNRSQATMTAAVQENLESRVFDWKMAVFRENRKESSSHAHTDEILKCVSLLTRTKLQPTLGCRKKMYIQHAADTKSWIGSLKPRSDHL